MNSQNSSFGAMRLAVKFFSTFVGLTLLILVLTLGLARWSFELGFLDFLNQLEQERLARISTPIIARYEQDDRSWDNLVDADLYALQSRPQRSQPRGRPRADGPRDGHPPPRRNRLENPGGVGSPVPMTALHDAQGAFIAGEPLTSDEYLVYELTLDDEVIGELRSIPPPLQNSNLASEFSQRQMQQSIAIGVACLLIAIFIAWQLTRWLTRPVNALHQSVKSLAKGDYGHQLSAQTRDEIGELINNVNQLSTTLEQNRAAKNRWFADISHELRTPLTIISGEIEALQDGIRPFTPESLQSLETEARLLKHLIDDLYDLSISDAGALRYTMTSGDLVVTINECLTAVENTLHDQNITLELDMPATLSCSYDHKRIEQLVLNLVANSLKYTDSPGKIRVVLQSRGHYVVLEIADTPPGCSVAECESLFEPLYRLDQARSRQAGRASAGLGLAIARNIVAAHNGTISAAPSDLGGLAVTAKMPIKEE